MNHPDAEPNVIPPPARAKRRRRGGSVTGAALVAGTANLALVAVMALSANSLTLWSDLLATLIDNLCVLAAWLTLRAVRHRRTDIFAFGHNRLESFSSLGVGQLMLLTFLIILAVAVWKFIHPEPIGGFGVYLGLVTNVVYLGINGVILWNTSALQRATESPTLAAQRFLYLSKVLSNALILVALGLALGFRRHSWAMYVDPSASVVIGLTLLFSATSTMRSSARNLVDRCLEERDQILVLQALSEHYQDFTMLHGIRTRRAGGNSFVELFLEFPPDRPVGEVQDVMTHLRRSIGSKLSRTDVTVVPTRTAPAGM